MERDIVTDKIIKKVVNDFESFLYSKIAKKGSKAWVGPHEIYAFTAEEVYEMMKALHKNDDKNFKEELFDTATCCLFGYMSMEQVGR